MATQAGSALLEVAQPPWGAAAGQQGDRGRATAGLRLVAGRTLPRAGAGRGHGQQPRGAGAGLVRWSWYRAMRPQQAKATKPQPVPAVHVAMARGTECPMATAAWQPGTGAHAHRPRGRGALLPRALAAGGGAKARRWRPCRGMCRGRAHMRAVLVANPQRPRGGAQPPRPFDLSAQPPGP